MDTIYSEDCKTQSAQWLAWRRPALEIYLVAASDKSMKAEQLLGIGISPFMEISQSRTIMGIGISPLMEISPTRPRSIMSILRWNTVTCGRRSAVHTNILPEAKVSAVKIQLWAQAIWWNGNSLKHAWRHPTGRCHYLCANFLLINTGLSANSPFWHGPVAVQHRFKLFEGKQNANCSTAKQQHWAPQDFNVIECSINYLQLDTLIHHNHIVQQCFLISCDLPIPKGQPRGVWDLTRLCPLWHRPSCIPSPTASGKSPPVVILAGSKL